MHSEIDTDGRTARYTIRELCDAFEVTPRALRFYEDQGLLAPLREGQRRLYSPRDRARLTLILRGKRFGFSLAEIRELLDLYDVGDQQVKQLESTLLTARDKLGLLEQRELELKSSIADLKQQIAQVERMLAERRRAPKSARAG